MCRARSASTATFVTETQQFFKRDEPSTSGDLLSKFEKTLRGCLTLRLGSWANQSRHGLPSAGDHQFVALLDTV